MEASSCCPFALLVWPVRIYLVLDSPPARGLSGTHPATTAGDTSRSPSISPANPTELPARIPNIVPVACDRTSESAEDPRQKDATEEKTAHCHQHRARPWQSAIQADEWTTRNKYRWRRTSPSFIT